MFRPFLMPAFASAHAAACHSSSYWEGRVLFTENAERRRGDNGGLFVLTCSSSLHTATSGDCCSLAACQCVYLLCAVGM